MLIRPMKVVIVTIYPNFNSIILAYSKHPVPVGNGGEKFSQKHRLKTSHKVWLTQICVFDFN